MSFISRLRSKTNYPTFRLLCQVAVGLLYLLGLVMLLGVFATGETVAIVFAVLGLLAFLVVVHALYEFTVMLMDIADATVHMAGGERGDESAAPNLDWERPRSPPIS